MPIEGSPAALFKLTNGRLGGKLLTAMLSSPGQSPSRPTCAAGSTGELAVWSKSIELSTTDSPVLRITESLLAF